MTHSGRRIAAQTLAGIAATGLLYVSTRSSFQAVEARLVVAVSNALGMGAHVIYERTFYFTLVPHRGLPLRIGVDYALSALAPIIAMVFLGLVSPQISVARRIAAVAVAASVIFAVNILRLVLSAVMTVYLGRTWVFLFNNFVGAMFTLTYTLAGFMTILFILLRTPQAKDGNKFAHRRAILDAAGVEYEDEV